MFRGLDTRIPVYVTRKDAEGLTGTWSIAGWFAVPTILLGTLNVLAWLTIAAVEGVSRIVEAVA